MPPVHTTAKYQIIKLILIDYADYTKVDLFKRKITLWG